MEDEISSKPLKHVWSAKEDAVFVDCLIDMRLRGYYMVKNNFKPGFLGYIERVMTDKLPGCGIKGIPHIQSRLKTLKSGWQEVYNMLYGPDTNGFSWDPIKNQVIADRIVWDEYIKCHKKAVAFRFKPFPHFEQLCMVWSKDMVSSRDAKTVFDIVNDTENKQDAKGDLLGDAPLPSEQGSNADITMDVAFTNGPNTPQSEGTLFVSRKRARRARFQEETIGDVIRDVCTQLDNGLREATRELAQAIRRLAHKSNIYDKIENLWEMLTKIPGLTQEEMTKAVVRIANDTTMLILLPTLPDDVKLSMIRDLIK